MDRSVKNTICLEYQGISEYKQQIDPTLFIGNGWLV